jgi:hypothetical protein
MKDAVLTEHWDMARAFEEEVAETAVELPAFVTQDRTPLPDYIFEDEAAWMLGMTTRALRDRRRRGTGPKLAGSCGFPKYLKEDLDAWQAEQQAKAERRRVQRQLATEGRH